VASTVDGAALYAANCAGCHGSLASSGKKGITVDRLQGAIANGTGGMGALAPLTASDVQAIVTALTPATPTPTPTPVPTPVLDGPTLYNANCAACHGPLTSSAKAGASSSRIQTAISNGIGGMGYLSSLSSTQLSALASALATVTPSPTPTTACGSCHAIPPAAGKHSKHAREGIACASCHGTGYSTTSFNAATHNNGVKNIATNTGWNSATRTCANACHGKESW
jgi:mono/diheme cytochrome c family protein